MEDKKQKELPMCENELDDDVNERKKNYRSIKRNKRCVSCCRKFGKS
jgi:hypothetical protein